MSDANTSRGKSIFLNLLESEILGGSQNAEILQELKEYYADKVGVMPLDELFGAKRMAESCIKAADVKISDGGDVTAIAEEFYKITNSKPLLAQRIENTSTVKNRGVIVEGYVNTGDDAHDAMTKNLAESITDTSSYNSEIFKIEDGDGEIHEMQVEVINMIDDAADEGALSIEGLRAVGAIEVNHDNLKQILTDGDVIELGNKFRKTNSSNWKKDEYDNLIILCEKCNSEKIYPFGYDDLFGCFDCNAEFQFKINLSDID